MKLKKLRFLSGIVSLTWIILLYYLNVFTGFTTPSSLILPLIATLFSAHFLIKGPSKKSSIFGKILIFGGLLALLTLIADKGLNFVNTDALVRILAVINGLFLERLSPHKKLKDFMFLAISTKIQFIFVTALMTLVNSNKVSELIFPINYWYTLVSLMAISVPFLALEKINIYRIFVWLTTFASIILFADFALTSAPPHTFFAFIAAIWPIIITRLIGRKVFFNKPISTIERVRKFTKK